MELQRKSGALERLYWLLGWGFDFTKIATIILIAILIVHYFVFSVLIVRGSSMEPNFNDGRLLAVNKIAYVLGKPKHGDVVAMYYPGESQKRFLKRVVAVPGDTISIRRGFVYINNEQIAESYLASELRTVPELERKLGVGEYFVIGDNRFHSSDSRAWGPVPEQFILGRVIN